MIKRLLSFALCLCLLSTATVAFADYDSQTPNAEGEFAGQSINITAIATDTAVDNSEQVYSVEIVWGDMVFAWGIQDASADGTTGTTLEWNPETHQYEDIDGNASTDLEKKWYMINNTEELTVAYDGKLEDSDTFVKKTQDSVMVFNHSSQPVDVTIAIDNADTVDTIVAAGITAGLDNADTAEAKKQLAVTVGDVYAEDSALVKQVKLSTPIDDTKIPTNGAAVVAALNVTISKVAAATPDPDTP